MQKEAWVMQKIYEEIKRGKCPEPRKKKKKRDER